MLTQLRIEHIATVDTLELSFSQGLSVITGESGAGKSLLFQAIHLLLGKPSATDLIRTGQDAALVEGCFHLTGPQSDLIQSFTEGDPELIIYRKLHRERGNTIKINNQTVTLKTLKAVAQDCAIIVGQHEHLTLMKPDYQRALIDSLADDHFHSIQDSYQECLKHYQTICQDIETLHTQANQSEQHKAFIEFQCNDIDQHHFKEGEDTQLEEKKQIMKGLSKNKSACYSLQQALTRANDLVKEAGSHQQILSLESSHVADLSTHIQTTSASLEDALYHSEQLTQHVQEVATDSIDDIESRLDIIFKYKQKYKMQTLHALLAFREQLQSQQDLEGSQSQRLAILTKEKETVVARLDDLASQLTQARQHIAASLVTRIHQHLSDLQFDYVDFDVQFESSDTFNNYGKDSLEFYISLNAGEPRRPLAKVASGGELSRILLAFYTIFTAHINIPLLLFDEIDTGVGGLTANAMGDHLAQLATQKQLICITHLAQIARHAASHIVVSKSFQQNVTTTHIHSLDDHEKKIELERMMGGTAVLQAVD